MCDVVAQRLHSLHKFIDWLQEVQCNKSDARVLPEYLCRLPPGRNDNLGPFGRWLTYEVFDNGIASDAIRTSDEGDLCVGWRHGFGVEVIRVQKTGWCEIDI